MPLTPADIHNVAFKKPPIGKRGYDEEEVDAFLDGIEHEIIRLIEENESLRRRSVHGPSAHEGDSLSAAGYAELSELRSRLQRVMSEKADTERVRDLLQDDLERARAQAASRTEGGAQDGQVTRVLEMAQQTADGHIADARREADKLVGSALGQAQSLVDEAQANAGKTEDTALQRYRDAIRTLENERDALQRRVEELTGFGRDYQERLRVEVTHRMHNMKDIPKLGPAPVFDESAWLRHRRPGRQNVSGDAR
ncbi:DivIVA domain-containing protein [Micromonospora peucetia]|uniref:Cell wall synthesis protein Wag31 n=1 Tax=Micromonospora peucetia TaxID=47871 RepID=A0A1C6VVH5_9ACTN|nr:DivIVA domain-containing protein [Micromonospora peucetia]MCX4388013.1 DivIVA domain-containing protein [Micromonospora peucetia]SCL70359.1 DivIVA domain-containing protein [Micromonospora peucetia]